MKERNTIECERFAEQNGFTGAVGGHFPDLPFAPPPTFKPALPPSALRLTAPRRVADRMEWLARAQEEATGTEEAGKDGAA